MTRTQRSGMLLILIAAAGYACLPIFAKWAYDAGLSPQAVVTWRFMIAAPCIWLLARRRGPSLEMLPVWPLLGAGLLFGLLALIAFAALERIPASLYTVLVYIYPACVTLISLLLGEKLHGWGWLALAMAFAGVVLTVPNIERGFAGGDPLGLFMGVSNAVLYAVYIVLTGRLLRGRGDMLRAGALSITGSLALLLALAPFYGLQAPADWQGWGSVLGVAILSTVIPAFTFLAGVQKLGAPRASIISTVEPVITLALAFALLGETFTPVQMLGGALILASPVLLQLRRGPAPAEQVAPLSASAD